ncbi:hypothetical protein [Paenarthrobacter sp. NPDC090522]
MVMHFPASDGDAEADTPAHHHEATERYSQELRTLLDGALKD